GEILSLIRRGEGRELKFHHHGDANRDSPLTRLGEGQIEVGQNAPGLLWVRGKGVQGASDLLNDVPFPQRIEDDIGELLAREMVEQDLRPLVVPCPREQGAPQAGAERSLRPLRQERGLAKTGIEG